MVKGERRMESIYNFLDSPYRMLLSDSYIEEENTISELEIRQSEQLEKLEAFMLRPDDFFLEYILPIHFYKNDFKLQTFDEMIKERWAESFEYCSTRYHDKVGMRKRRNEQRQRE